MSSGGFADNYIFDDTWYFNITTGRWLQKKKSVLRLVIIYNLNLTFVPTFRFVRPIYPESCTDDFEYIAENDCVNMSWPRSLERNRYAMQLQHKKMQINFWFLLCDRFYPFNILPYYQQKYYWPDPNNGPYYGILPKGTSESTDLEALEYSNLAPVGTPLFPYAATGPMQYAKPFFFSFNSTHNATLVESCTSVFGEPTRGKVLDGLFGRASSPVLIAQPRPRRPGWDGCRDRYDGSTDLENALQYVQPLPRYSHRAIFIPNTSEIIMYGGMAYTQFEARSIRTTYASSVLSDMWYYSLNHCSNNCSSNGDCFFGFCICYTGYYGEDCSNISCPGTYCYYEEHTFEQICVHACQAGYEHTDADIYVQDISKLPCSQYHKGYSHGICDGFGTAQCAPPFIGDDCSTKDCKNNCSFNGWCSIEYPVSRCMCQPGYFGEICDQKLCLNNCSYPNGQCNTTSGDCICNMVYSPYNNTRPYHPWGGEDCSFVFPYSAASYTSVLTITTRIPVWLLMILAIVTVYLSDISSLWEDCLGYDTKNKMHLSVEASPFVIDHMATPIATDKMESFAIPISTTLEESGIDNDFRDDDISNPFHIQIIVSIPSANGTSVETPYSLTISYGDSIHDKLESLCKQMSSEDCRKYEDTISLSLYQYYYTPTTSVRSQDFTASRIDILLYLQNKYNFKSYLEIGTYMNECFLKMQQEMQLAIGIDPQQGGNVRMTSDQFFAQFFGRGISAKNFVMGVHDFERNIATNPVQLLDINGDIITISKTMDLIFIDGLHEANQVVRDIQNSLNILSPNGIIVMHDCNARNEIVQRYPRHELAHAWTGDVWKAAVAMRLRQDIEIVVVDIDMGVGVIRKRANPKPLPIEWQNYLGINPISMLTYDHISNYRDTLLRLISVSDLKKWLDN